MTATRITWLLGAALVAASGCAGADGTDRGAIRENVIEPGITAIDQSTELACGTDASTIRAALQSYEMLEGEPAPDEAALVAREYLRAESELWDVDGGALVPADPACGDVPAELPATEIVTSTESPGEEAAADVADQLDRMTADDILDTLTADDIAEVGGRDCALEVAEVGLAFSRWQIANQTTDLVTLQQIVDAGFLAPLELWTTTDTQLIPVDGTDCIGPLDLLEPAG